MGVLFLIIGLIFAQSASAQAVPDTLYFITDTLKVGATRATISSAGAPLSLSITGRSERASSGDAATSLASITHELPGLWINDRQNAALGQRITIRGLGWRSAFGVRGIQVVLDGIPLTVADGQSITNIIDPAFIKRIELIRGPAGSYWGNSSGGVLYLSTKPDFNTDKHFYLRSLAGSYGLKKEEFRFHQQKGPLQVDSYASYQYQEGYRDYSTSKLLRAGLQGRYNFSSKSHLEYQAAFLGMPEAESPSGLTAAQVVENPKQANSASVASDAGKQVYQPQAGISYLRDTSAGLLTVSGYGIYRDLTNPLPYAIITVNRLAGGFRGTLEKSYQHVTLSGGAEVKLQHDDREEFETNNGNRGLATVNQTEKVKNEALFFTPGFTIGSLKLLGGLRYDRITFATDSVNSVTVGDRTFDAVSPSIGLSYNASNPVTLFTNLSTSFESPTTTELVNRPDGGNGFNANLKPERTKGIEVGSRGSVADGFLQYDVTLYQLWIRDLLFPYQLQPNGAVYYQNQGETQHRGIEMSATIYPTANLTFQATYTFTHATFKEAQTLDSLSLQGHSIPGIPKSRLAGSITWKPGSFWTQLSARYAGAYAVNNINDAFNDAYLTADAKISYQKIFIRSGIVLTPFLNIHNLFDTQYNGSVTVNASGAKYYEPAPGRNWQAGVSIRF